MPSNVRYCPPAWASGHITAAEAGFLADFVATCEPPSVVEIGVASGVSSAIILQALAVTERATKSAVPRLFSFDVAERCYFDNARHVGEAVHEMVPDLSNLWSLSLGNVLDAERILRGRDLALGFIDADHRHPWPTVDFLGLLPIFRPGAWVVLHDVRLSQTYGPGPMYDNHGAEYLFDAWPWTKRRQGNIGAVRLDVDVPRHEIFACCARLFDVHWEAAIPHDLLFELWARQGEAGLGADEAWDARVVSGLRRRVAAGRELVLWGAGAGGRHFLARLRAEGLRVAAFVDKDVRKAGQLLDDVEIRSPDSLAVDISRRPFVAICSMFADQIAADLESRGFTQGRDYVIA